METYFATPERLDRQELSVEIDIASKNPIMSGLLNAVNGLLAVLDEHRQIISLNDSFLEMLGISDPEKTLGLRMGEVLGCIHTHDEPAGCGTTSYCSSCGAAVAMVASLGQNKSIERICALSTQKNGVNQDFSLLVRSHPIDIENKRFLLLFVQDITQQQNRSALERTFFHDVNNMLGMLLGASELLVDQQPSDLADSVHQAALRLSKEVAIQQCLTRSDSAKYQTLRHKVTLNKIMEDLKSFFSSHTAAKNKAISFPKNIDAVSIITDSSLLLRILCNMVINALEASTEADIVKIKIEKIERTICFHVWNRQDIPKDIAQRIFQRNFSTKTQAGRGIGTFSMKLFGEKILGGKVSFITSKDKGTTFTYAAPL